MGQAVLVTGTLYPGHNDKLRPLHKLVNNGWDEGQPRKDCITIKTWQVLSLGPLRASRALGAGQTAPVFLLCPVLLLAVLHIICTSISVCVLDCACMQILE